MRAEAAGTDPRVPLYQRVHDALLAEVSALPAGARLPTEPELMRRFGVSRTTLRAAVDELVRSGLVMRRSGSGTFVADPRLEHELTRLTGFVEDMQALNRRAHALVVTRRRISPPARVAQQLRVAATDQVVLIERVRLADDEPISFDVTYLPLGVGTRVAQEDLAVYPIFELLESKYGIALGDAEYRIEAANAERRVARQLGVRVNAALLRIERTTYARSGEPIDYEILHYRGDRVRYRFHVTR